MLSSYYVINPIEKKLINILRIYFSSILRSLLILLLGVRNVQVFREKDIYINWKIIFSSWFSIRINVFPISYLQLIPLLRKSHSHRNFHIQPKASELNQLSQFYVNSSVNHIYQTLTGDSIFTIEKLPMV